MVVVNKWDLVPKETNTMKAFEAEVRQRLAPFTDVPVVFTSVLEKQRIHKVMELAMQVHADRARKIPTRQLNDVMLPEVERMGPPMYKGKTVRIKFINQLPTPVPSSPSTPTCRSTSRRPTSASWRTSCASTSASPACPCASSCARSEGCRSGSVAPHGRLSGATATLATCFGVPPPGC